MPNETVASKMFKARIGEFNETTLMVVEASFAQGLEDTIETLEIRHAAAMLHTQAVVDENTALRQQITEAKRDADNCRQIIDTYSRQEDDLIQATKQLAQLAATERQLRSALKDWLAWYEDSGALGGPIITTDHALKISAQHEAAGVTTGVNNATAKTSTQSQPG